MRGKGRDLRPAHDRAVVIHQLRQHSNRRQPGKSAKIDTRLGMARAHQYAAFFGDQRKDVARPDEIGCTHVAVGKRAHRVSPLLGRNARSQAMPHVDRNGKGGAKWRIVSRHHGIKMEPPRLILRHRSANNPRRVADNEGHLLRRAQRCSDE